MHEISDIRLCVIESVGWWFVQVEQEQGWAPASYLCPLDEDDDGEIPGNIGTSPKYASKILFLFLKGFLFIFLHAKQYCTQLYSLMRYW